MGGVALATEDELSEAVGIRLIEEAGMSVALTLRRGGFGYLKGNMTKWINLVHNGTPLVVLTDSDSTGCAVHLLADWTQGKRLPKNLLLRVAVREVEAWLLADHAAFGNFLGTRGKLPPHPEALHDPKQTLLNLAKRAPKPMRRDLVAAEGAAARQGLAYNLRLCAFVRATWRPEHAAQRCPSLARARAAIAKLAGRV